MTRKIVFFINPISGTANKRNLQRKIYRTCVQHGVAFEILYTSQDGDYAFLREKIIQDEITDIIICGGDGSLRQIVAATLGANVNIGIIPAGSGNGLARTVGIPMNTNEALKVIFAAKAKPVDAISVNNRLSCHLVGIGFDAQIAHAFAKRKNRGFRGYAGEILKQLTGLRFFRFELMSNDRQFHETASCIVVANSNQFGNNVKIAPAASICDQVLDIVIFRKAGTSATILSLLRQMLTGKAQSLTSPSVEKKGVLYYQTSSLRVKNPEMAPIHVDGDPVDTWPEVTIEVIPLAYRLLQP